MGIMLLRTEEATAVVEVISLSTAVVVVVVVAAAVVEQCLEHNLLLVGLLLADDLLPQPERLERGHLFPQGGDLGPQDGVLLLKEIGPHDHVIFSEKEWSKRKDIEAISVV